MEKVLIGIKVHLDPTSHRNKRRDVFLKRIGRTTSFERISGINKTNKLTVSVRKRLESREELSSTRSAFYLHRKHVESEMMENLSEITRKKISGMLGRPLSSDGPTPKTLSGLFRFSYFCSKFTNFFATLQAPYRLYREPKFGFGFTDGTR